MNPRVSFRNWMALSGLIALSLPLAAQTGVSIPQPAPEKQQVGAGQIRLIEPEVTLIVEETGLGMDSADLTKGEQVRAAKLTTEHPISPSSHTVNVQGPQTAKSVKLYRFQLQPKESITFALETAETSRVFLKLGEMKDGEAPSAATLGQLERINRVQPVSRSKKMQFRNMESRPYMVLLVAYGENGYPFKIHITRKS